MEKLIKNGELNKKELLRRFDSKDKKIFTKNKYFISDQAFCEMNNNFIEYTYKNGFGVTMTFLYSFQIENRFFDIEFDYVDTGIEQYCHFCYMVENVKLKLIQIPKKRKIKNFEIMNYYFPYFGASSQKCLSDEAIEIMEECSDDNAYECEKKVLEHRDALVETIINSVKERIKYITVCIYNSKTEEKYSKILIFENNR